MSDASELLQIANESYCPGPSKKKGISVYRGWQYAAAVGKAMEGKFTEGKHKARLAVARQTTGVLFDHARVAPTSKMAAVCACVSPDGQIVATASGEQSALEAFAQEVWESLNSMDGHERTMGTPNSELISTIIDPSMIISLIMAIIQAIRNCKNPAPAPVSA